MCLTFFISCLLVRNVSLKVFLWQLCCRVWRCSVCSLFNPREIAVSKTPVHFYHNSSYRCYMLFFFAQTLTLCLEASGWREFAHGRFLRSSHCRSYLSLFLSLWLHLLLCLSCSVSLIPLQLLSVETIKPISFSDTLTGCPGWTKTQEPGFPKTVTWFKAANKLAANYLSNTCWWRR